MAREAAERGDYAAAASLAERALRLSRTDFSTTARLLDARAAYLEAGGDLRGAAGAARELIAHAPGSARGYLRLGKVLRLQGETSRALCVYRTAADAVIGAEGQRAVQAQLAAMERRSKKGCAVDVFGALPYDVCLRILAAMDVRSRWAALRASRAAFGLLPAFLPVPRLLRAAVKQGNDALRIGDIEVCSMSGLKSLAHSSSAGWIERLTISGVSLGFDLPRTFPKLQALRLRSCRISSAQSLLQWLSCLPLLDLHIDACSSIDAGPEAHIRTTRPMNSLVLHGCDDSWLWPAVIRMFDVRRLSTDHCIDRAGIVETRAHAHVRGNLFLIIGSDTKVGSILQNLRSAWLHTRDGLLVNAIRSLANSSPHLERLFVSGCGTHASAIISAAGAFSRLRVLGLLISADADWRGLAASAAVSAVRASCSAATALLLPAADAVPGAALAATNAAGPNLRIVTEPALCRAIASRGFRIPKDAI